jgi:hypothetical protein
MDHPPALQTDSINGSHVGTNGHAPTMTPSRFETPESFRDGLDAVNQAHGRIREEAGNVPSRRIPEGDADNSRVDRLIDACAMLSDSIRDMSTSWSVERARLIKKIDEMDHKLADVPLIKREVEDISGFISGGNKGHLGERIHEHALKIEDLERAHRDRQREKSKSFWVMVAFFTTVGGGAIVEGLKLLLEFSKK